MIPDLTFRPNGLGRELVMLGEEVVGDVTPFPDRKVRAVWTFYYERRIAQPAADLADARNIIERRINAWLMRLGVFYPGQTVRRIDHSECEREARAG